MFKQGSNQSGSGGRLVIPKNSKWSLAAGICMLINIILLLPYNISTYLYSPYFPIISNMILNDVIWYLPFIVIAFLPKKNIKLFLIPLTISSFILLISYINPTLINGIRPPLEYAIIRTNYSYYMNYIPFIFQIISYISFIVIFILIGDGKLCNKKYIIYIASTIIIGFIILTLFGQIIFSYSIRIKPVINPPYSIISFVMFNYVPYLLLILGLTVPLCPKCGAPLTNAGKFCNICGEQLDK